MLFPKNLYKKLQFDQVLELIKGFCLNEIGKDYVDQLKFGTDKDAIQKALNETLEFNDLIQSENNLKEVKISKVSDFLKDIAPENSWLTIEQAFSILTLCKNYFEIGSFLRKYSKEYPYIAERTPPVLTCASIVKHLMPVIDLKGNILSTASPTYNRITKEITKLDGETKAITAKVFRKLIADGYTSGGNLTIRNERIVIPVDASHKKKIKGFVHDVSSSGQTVFLEPQEVHDLNNQLNELKAHKKNEVRKILLALTDIIRPYSEELVEYEEYLAWLDFTRAKAKFMIKIDAKVPELVDSAEVSLKNARHPLLVFDSIKSKKKIIGFDLSLGEKHSAIIISGANAGGKTATLKTVGLIQLMIQNGIPVPCDESSKVGLVSNLFVEIGDDQNINNELSTYSAHLTNMKYIIEHSSHNTLVLVDELGAGTDPAYGEPIAQAMLEHLIDRKAKVIVTTHFSQIKSFAYKNPKAVNANLGFDIEKMEPTYNFKIGTPGSSFTLEIAKKIGLKGSIISSAENKMAKSSVESSNIISQLEKDTISLNQKMEMVDTNLKLHEKLRNEVSSVKKQLEDNKKDIIDAARKKALEIIEQSNKLIEQTISQIKKDKAAPEATKPLRRKIAEAREELQDAIKESEKEAYKTNYKIKVGDIVVLSGGNAEVTVMQLRNETAVVASDNVKTTVQLSRLKPIENKTPVKKKSSNISTQLIKKRQNFVAHIDLRGLRAEEALAKVEKFMDDAMVLGAGEVKLLHGKGEGILRAMIRDFLSDYPNIKSLEDEKDDKGGSGITVVNFKD
ncbi:MAG: DNA mismatch repair protein MutS2 [Sphingobacteriales bacterium]|jgi:DNA mismatch repair protein MutS2